MVEQHKLSWGSISVSEQENFIDFLLEFSDIFQHNIQEIHLSTTLPKSRALIPEDEKELFFFIEKQKDDRAMDIKYFITQEDLILLTRNSRFYTTILMERAFSVIFNKVVVGAEDLYNEFKQAIGHKNIEAADRYFKVRGKRMTENRLLRKMFIQNGLLFVQNKTGQLTHEILNFMNNIFQKKKQLA